MSASTYRLINLLATSLRIEDLGVTLQARGGTDSTCVVSADSYNRSSSLREHLRKRWVSVRPLNEGAQMPIWPLSKPPTPAPAADPAPVPSPSFAADDSALRAEVRSLSSRLDEVLGLLRAGAGAGAGSAPSPSYAQTPSSQRRPDGSSVSSDPMFIPTRIVPSDADVHISVSEESSAGGNFDESLSALKRARKKQ